MGVLLFLSVLVNMRSCGTPTEIAGMGNRHTAVINLSGTIGDPYTDQVAMLREGLGNAYANSNVRGIIIRANSPGGSPVVVQHRL